MPRPLTTHTYVLMEVSGAAYDEVAGQLRSAGYDHAFGDEGEIDLHGLALIRAPEPTPQEAMFPVMVDYFIGAGRQTIRKMYPSCPTAIPYALVAAHEEQAQRNHGQSVARLKERGGLSPYELKCLLTDQRPFRLPLSEDVLAAQWLAARFAPQRMDADASLA